MSDDDELFEREMALLGTKRGGRAAVRADKAPEGVQVDEDLDFDAAMRAGRGPAKEIRGAKTVAAAPVAEVEAVTASAPKPVERSRYTATAEESREFLAAMEGLEPPARGETGSAARVRSSEDDLARRLKRREVESDAVLDLHGKTQKDARARLAAFIKEARTEGWRVVTIVVGRGLRSDRGEAVLRPLVQRWLLDEHRGDVTEVHEAPSYLGGSGAWLAAIARAR